MTRNAQADAEQLPQAFMSVQMLLSAGALSTVRTLLGTSPLLRAGAGGTALLRSPDQLHDVLGLLAELLPPLQDSSELMGGPGAPPPPVPPDGVLVKSARSQDFASFLAGHEELTRALADEVLPLVLSAFTGVLLPEVGLSWGWTLRVWLPRGD
jgi:E3 ubiquitin-protein ligase TRIP12